jgi:hypothetical protein
MTPYEQGRQAALVKVAGLAQIMEGNLPHALEVAGLATLAAPTVNDMVDPPWIQTEKRRHQAHLAELAGLGMLSLPSIGHMLTKVK